MHNLSLSSAGFACERVTLPCALSGVSGQCHDRPVCRHRDHYPCGIVGLRRVKGQVRPGMYFTHSGHCCENGCWPELHLSPLHPGQALDPGSAEAIEAVHPEQVITHGSRDPATRCRSGLRLSDGPDHVRRCIPANALRQLTLPVATFAPLGIPCRVKYWMPQHDREMACGNYVFSRIDAALHKMASA